MILLKWTNLPGECYTRLSAINGNRFCINKKQHKHAKEYDQNNMEKVKRHGSEVIVRNPRTK